MARTDAQALLFDAGATCSRCTAAPLVKYSHEGLELDLPFCGHHATKHQQALLDQGFVISVDLRPGAAGTSESPTLASMPGA